MTRSLDTAVRGWLSEAHTELDRTAASLSRGPVLVGAGKLGRRISSVLRRNGIEPVAFADNASRLWGQSIEGVPVLAPAEAVRLYGAAHPFVITIWNPARTSAFLALESQLVGLGASQVMTFVPVARLYPAELLPHYLWDTLHHFEDSLPAIAAAAELFEEPASRREFESHLEFRITGRAAVLPPLDPCDQYFPDFLSPRDDEHLVDCGAYDGDTARDFHKWTGGRFRRITAFEPDAACRTRLNDSLAALEILERCEVRPEVVWSHATTLRFSANGEASAAVSNSGDVELAAVAIDDLDLDRPTFLKLDIEGAESDALCGARRTIQSARPLLAVCVYHQQSDLWRLPLQMQDLSPDGAFRLRSHRADGLDAVCYFTPA